jgi:hypothetical protein
VACILGGASPQVWCDSAAGRLRRGLSRIGITDFIGEDALAETREAVLLLRGDAVIDGPLLQALPTAPGAVLLSNGAAAGVPLAAHAPAGLAEAAAGVLKGGPAGALPDGLRATDAAGLGAAYWEALRKREEPYALQVVPARLKAIEWRMLMGTYKGATDLVTKYLWPRPAFHATKLCARLGITPNQVTALSLVLVIAAFWWFWQAGNSGGPLVDMYGAVVGLNTATVGRGELGFAIPIDAIQAVLPQLHQSGDVRRGWLGVQIRPLDGDNTYETGIGRNQGVYVLDVLNDQPAHRAGILAGDVITQFNGAVVQTPLDLQSAVAGTPVGMTVQVQLLRKKARQVVQLTVGEMPVESQ